MALRADLPGLRRVLLDGWGSDRLAADLCAALADRGRTPVHVPSRGFWRPAGERFTHGREDWQAYRDTWLDSAALRREVLGRDADYLPALWDVDRDRSARSNRQPFPDHAVVVVDGVFLQGLGLPADLTVHMALSPGALRRQGVDVWQLPAFTTYDEEVRPGDLADVLVRAEDPVRPAVRWRPYTSR